MPDVVERGGECVAFVVAQQVEIAPGDFDELSGLGERRRLDPMLKARHDVILYGAAILEAVMDGANIPEISVSTRDGMEGYLDYLETKTS